MHQVKAVISDFSDQRFHPILSDALHVGLETTMLKSELTALRQAMADFQKKNAELGGGKLPNAVIRDPNARGDKPEAKTISVIHPGISLDFQTDLLMAPTEDGLANEVCFWNLTTDIPTLFQRLNLKQTPSRNILGLVCGRHGETTPFPVRLKDQSERDRVGYANLDFLSRTSSWNPVFVKYRLCTAMKDLETGYVRIDAFKKNTDAHGLLQVVAVKCGRVPESEVPEFLKTAKTFPE